MPWASPDDSAVHRTFQRWVTRGIGERRWASVQEQGEDRGGGAWAWQAADRWLGKARLGGDRGGPHPTDRAPPGVQRSLLVAADGGPLASPIAGATVPDAPLRAGTIDAVVLERPESEPDDRQPRCLDNGFDNDTGWEATIDHEYDPHLVPSRDERPPRPQRHQPRRWVVARTRAWLAKCRGLLIRGAQAAAHYRGLLQVAGSLRWFRRWHRLALRG